LIEFINPKKVKMIDIVEKNKSRFEKMKGGAEQQVFDIVAAARRLGPDDEEDFTRYCC
jgi:hypothetical protein